MLLPLLLLLLLLQLFLFFVPVPAPDRGRRRTVAVVVAAFDVIVPAADVPAVFVAVDMLAVVCLSFFPAVIRP